MRGCRIWLRTVLAAAVVLAAGAGMAGFVGRAQSADNAADPPPASPEEKPPVSPKEKPPPSLEKRTDDAIKTFEKVLYGEAVPQGEAVQQGEAVPEGSGIRVRRVFPQWHRTYRQTLFKAKPQSEPDRAKQAPADNGNGPFKYWAVGAGGSIASSVDEGATWRFAWTETTADLKDILVLSPEQVPFGYSGPTGWAVGDKGTVLTSFDWGRTWRRARTVQNGNDAVDLTCLEWEGMKAYAASDCDGNDSGSVRYALQEDGLNWLDFSTKVASGGSAEAVTDSRWVPVTAEGNPEDMVSGKNGGSPPPRFAGEAVWFCDAADGLVLSWTMKQTDVKEWKWFRFEADRDRIVSRTLESGVSSACTEQVGSTGPLSGLGDNPRDTLLNEDFAVAGGVPKKDVKVSIKECVGDAELDYGQFSIVRDPKTTARVLAGQGCLWTSPTREGQWRRIVKLHGTLEDTDPVFVSNNIAISRSAKWIWTIGKKKVQIYSDFGEIYLSSKQGLSKKEENALIESGKDSLSLADISVDAAGRSARLVGTKGMFLRAELTTARRHGTLENVQLHVHRVKLSITDDLHTVFHSGRHNAGFLVGAGAVYFYQETASLPSLAHIREKRCKLFRNSRSAWARFGPAVEEAAGEVQTACVREERAKRR